MPVGLAGMEYVWQTHQWWKCILGNRQQNLPVKGNVGWKSYPTPEGDKEPEPSEEEHTTIQIERVKPGN